MGPDPQTNPSDKQLNAALLLLRLAVAIVFLYHGSAILFGAFGGPGPGRVAATMHVPAVVGYLIGLAQVGGAIAILTGILFRVGAVCILIVMLGAIFLVHLPHGFSIANNGVEFALTEFLMTIALLITGPGAYSLSAWLPSPLRRL